MGLILDTSILIAAEKERFDLDGFFAANEPKSFCIAAITAAEILHGVERAKPESRKLARGRFVEWILSDLEIIDFGVTIARRHALIWATLEAAGTRIGPHDLIIAATALQFDHSLATLNSGEFRQVPGLHLADVSRHVRAAS